MGIAWITLSSRWGITSVQAALNVIISTMGIFSVWAFSRYWWQRGSVKVLRNNTDVPLSTLFTVSSPGESWDVMAVLKKRLFVKGNWHLLVQITVVVGMTIACALAGPIAKVSLRNGEAVMQREVHGLPTTKGAGAFGNILNANVLWNETIQSLDSAEFPMNQLLDYLPPSTDPWTYVKNEWDPTWRATCVYTEETMLYDLNGTGEHNFFDPINAFPAYRDTFSPSWLDRSKYKIVSDFNNWQDWTKEIQQEHVLWYTVIQSDPEIHDRLFYNNDSLDLSISILHAQNFRALYEDPTPVTGELSWRPIGPVGNASFTRAECKIIRKDVVIDENNVPWPWTNITSSIVASYRAYWEEPLVAVAGVRNLPIAVPSGRDAFRFYQAYMVSVNTFHSDIQPHKFSLRVQTVEVSLVFILILGILLILTIWLSIRYFLFFRRHKPQIQEMYLPDGKIEWMIHAAKSSEVEDDASLSAARQQNKKDRDHFCTATFGPIRSQVCNTCDPDAGPQMPKLARVMSSKSSFSLSPSGRAPAFGSRVRSPVKEDGEMQQFRQWQNSVITNSINSTVVSPAPTSKGSRDCSPGPGAESVRRSLTIEVDDRFLSVGHRCMSSKSAHSSDGCSSKLSVESTRPEVASADK